MTTTPPPITHPDPHSTTWSPSEWRWIEARDAQWMERIAALEAENKRFRDHLKKQNVELDELIPMAQKLEADRKMLRDAFRNLYRAYVRLLENGRDRICDLGGQCDPVDAMEANDPFLKEARTALERTHGN